MAELDLGNLVVKLSADIDQLKADFSAAQRETQRTADEASKLTKAFNAAFNGTATAATRLAGNLNQVGESIVKVFGDNGLKSARSYAKELGFGTEQVEAMSVALKGLGGAFSAVAVAAGALTTPIGAALAMTLGLIAAYGALKKAMPEQMANAKTGLGIIADGGFGGDKAKEVYLTGEKGKADLELYKVLRQKFEREGSLGGPEAEAYYELQTRMPSSVVNPGAAPKEESGSQIEIIGAFRESMAEGLKDFEGITSKIKELFAPDTSKKDLEEKKKLAAESNKAERERQKSLQEAFAEQKQIYDEEVKAREEEAAALKKAMEAEQKAREDAADAIAASIEAANATWRENQDALDSAVSNARMGGPSGPARSANGGPTMTEAELDKQTENDKQGFGARAGAKDLGNAALQGSGVGDYVAAFQKGGGIIGGIINVVLKLFEKSEGFKAILSMVNDVVQMLADGLGQIFDGLQPIIGVLGWLVEFIIGVLEPIISKVGKVLEPFAATLAMSMVALEGLAPLLDFFAQAIGGVLQAIGWIIKNIIFPITQAVNFAVMKVAQAVSWVINGIIDIVSAVIWEVGAILQKMGAQDAGSALKAAANAMHEYEIDTKAINDAANAMWDMSYDDALKKANDTLVPLDDLGDSAGDAADSIKEFSEAITNVPSGYKVALARFNATTPVNAETVLGGSSTTTNTFAVTIKTDDAASLWAELKKLMERDSVIESGSPISGAPEFLAV